MLLVVPTRAKARVSSAAFAALLTVAMASLAIVSWAAPKNLYEWVATSPIVIAGEVLGQEGRHTSIRVDHVLRGDLEPASSVLINLRYANRSRSYTVDQKALRFETGRSYMVLLRHPDESPKPGREPVYRLVRGVRGARELPAEGSPAILEALDQFVEIQDRRSEQVSWRRFSRMLEATNPILIETAMDQFLKFRRGTVDLLLTLQPLLDHPLDPIRERTAKLVRDILVRNSGMAEIPEEAALRSALIARARRDSVIPVRVAACEALEGFQDLASQEVLEEIAAKDPNQEVRYAAEKLLFDRRSRHDP